MSTTPTSSAGSSASNSKPPWTPVEARDTTPEAAAAVFSRRRGLSPAERAEEALAWCDEVNLLRYNIIRQRNPGATEAELTALWTEETYRDTVDPAFLAKVVAAIRAQPTEPRP